MARHIQTISGTGGYRDQLARARRFLDRVLRQPVEWDEWDDVAFQDFMWAFFQNCWHLKDWIAKDPVMPAATKEALKIAIRASPILPIARDMANGTKHFKLDSANIRAQHHHVDTTIIPGVSTQMDLLVEMGDGSLRSGLDVAKECIAEWESILKSAGLPI